jgi:AP-3 complex subunit delta
VSVQRVYVQAIPKVFSTWACEITSTWNAQRKIELEFVVDQICLWMDFFQYSTDLEVQERAVCFCQIFRRIQQEIKSTPIPTSQEYHDEATESWDSSPPQTGFPSIPDLAMLFGDIELNPVGATAQKRVPIPDGLDLYTPFYTGQEHFSWPDDSLEDDVPKPKTIIGSAVSEMRRREQLNRLRDDPFYIGDHRRPISGMNTPVTEEDDLDSIPIVQFDGGTNLLTPLTKVRKKRKKAREVVLEDPVVDIAGDEMPENAVLVDIAGDTGPPLENKRIAHNMLSGKQGKGLEDIDFEEEERLEKEAMEAERQARQTRSMQAEKASEEPPLVLAEPVKKKSRKKGESSKKTKKKKKSDQVE